MEKSPPKVYKVKDEETINKFEGLHPHLPQPPSLLLIIGSVRSGKSNLLVNMLCSPEMYKDRFEEVHIISNTLNADPKGKLLAKYFSCEDHYDDTMIEAIVEKQKSYEDLDRPNIAVVLDHYGIGLLAFTTQSFRAVSGLIRNNATDIIIMKQQNQRELEKVIEEYGDLFGTGDNFKKLYNEAMKERYSFLYLDLQTNPAKAYVRFERLIGEGEKLLF